MSVTVKCPAAVHGLLNAQPSMEAESAPWAMNRHERVEAMWRGELTLFQLSKWAAKLSAHSGLRRTAGCRLASRP